MKVCERGKLLSFHSSTQQRCLLCAGWRGSQQGGARWTAFPREHWRGDRCSWCSVWLWQLSRIQSSEPAAFNSHSQWDNMLGLWIPQQHWLATYRSQSLNTPTGTWPQTSMHCTLSLSPACIHVIFGCKPSLGMAAGGLFLMYYSKVQLQLLLWIEEDHTI